MPTLSLWTIYDHPSDYPDSYVARRFELDQLTPGVVVSSDLEELRAHFIPMGLTCLTRSPEDAPQIVETWL